MAKFDYSKGLNQDLQIQQPDVAKSVHLDVEHVIPFDARVSRKPNGEMDRGPSGYPRAEMLVDLGNSYFGYVTYDMVGSPKERFMVANIYKFKDGTSKDDIFFNTRVSSDMERIFPSMLDPESNAKIMDGIEKACNKDFAMSKQDYIDVRTDTLSRAHQSVRDLVGNDIAAGYPHYAQNMLYHWSKETLRGQPFLANADRLPTDIFRACELEEAKTAQKSADVQKTVDNALDKFQTVKDKAENQAGISTDNPGVK